MAEPLEDLLEAYRALRCGYFYTFAPEFTSIEHLAPQLAVEQPFVRRPDGSYIQLEYRAGSVIPWAVTRYHLPDASINGAIVCGSRANAPKLKAVTK